MREPADRWNRRPQERPAANKRVLIPRGGCFWATVTTVLIVAAGVWLWAAERKWSREAAIADSPLHQVILKARHGNTDAAVEEFLPESFDEAVTVLAETAKIRQPFARPIKIYDKSKIPTWKGLHVGSAHPMSILRTVLERRLKMEVSAVRAGTCAELWFPNRSLLTGPTRLPVYLYEMNDGSVRAHANRQKRMCWGRR